jgi:hypothetical protein
VLQQSGQPTAATMPSRACLTRPRQARGQTQRQSHRELQGQGNPCDGQEAASLVSSRRQMTPPEQLPASRVGIIQARHASPSQTLPPAYLMCSLFLVILSSVSAVSGSRPLQSLSRVFGHFFRILLFSRGCGRD